MMLKEFARFIRENHLEDFAREERRLLAEFDVPLLRLFAHLSEEEFHRMTVASLEGFLTDLETGRALETAAENLRLWEADKLPGIPKESIEPKDLVLVYTAQKEAMLGFLEPFTTEVRQAVKVVEELEEHFRKVQEAAFQTFANLRAQITERAARAKGEADAAQRYAKALQASNEELTGQAEELAAQQEELQHLYDAIQAQNERLEATVAERTRVLTKQASLLQLTQDAILVRDWEEGNVSFWNRGAEDMYGWTHPEAMGRRLLELLKTEFPKPFPEVVCELEQAGRWEGELVHTRKDGSRLVVASRWALQRDAQGQPLAILEINTDITERKRADQQQRLFELLVKNVSDFAIYMLDPQGRVVSWNEGAQKLKGYTEDEIIGRHFSVFFPPEEVAAGTPAQLLARAEQEGHEEDEGWRVRKNGSAFWADAVLTPIYDNNVLVGFAKVTRDLSDRKRAEEALRDSNEELQAANEELQAANEELSSQSEELQVQQAELQRQSDELARQRLFLENLVRNLPVAIAYLDKDLVYRWVNPAWEQAETIAAEHVVGRHVSEALPHFQEAAQRVQKVLDTGEKLQFTAVPSALNRDTYWDVVYVPLTASDHGDVEGVITVALDVTDRVEREQLQRERIETMERVDTLKDQFLSILSHELRTPINAIMGFGSILEDGLAGPMRAVQARYLRKMLGGAETLLSLVNDLLDMSRIQAGKFTLEPRVTYFQDLAADVIANLMPLAEQKHLTLLSEIPQDLPGLVADEQRVSQILVNLINNAIKFTDAGGAITVRALIEGGDQREVRNERHLRCEVQDTGIGIAIENQPKLFQRFSQLDTSNTRTTSGTGLGLSIVKALVEAHGGAVGVKSAPGEGSTFWFTLPLDATTAAQPASNSPTNR